MRFNQKQAQRPLLLLLLLPVLILAVAWLVSFPAQPTWERAGLALGLLMEPGKDLITLVEIVFLSVLGFMILKHLKRGLWAFLVCAPWTLLIQLVGTALAIRWVEPDIYWGHTFTGFVALPFALAAGIATSIAVFTWSGKSLEAQENRAPQQGTSSEEDHEVRSP